MMKKFIAAALSWLFGIKGEGEFSPKYMPHQGKRECERRRRQRSAA